MADGDWSTFGVLILAITVAVVALARLSARQLRVDSSTSEVDVHAVPQSPPLLYNLALTHVVIAAAVLGATWISGVPLRALGVTWPPDILGALLLGVGIFAVGESLSAVTTRLGIREPEQLRELMAPSSREEWILLLGGVLPVVAVTEELLFRGALVGGLATGWAVSPWLLVVVSGLAFGLSHVAQGRYGVVVASVVGFVFAATFLLTNDLFLVVIAHYLVDVFEFVVHEGGTPG